MTDHPAPDQRHAPGATQITPSTVLAAVERAQAVAQYAANGTLVAANARFEALLGADHQALLGRPHDRLCIAGDGAQARHTALWQRLAQGDVTQEDFLYQAVDGRHVWLHSLFAPSLDASGVLTDVVQFATDISDLRQHDAEVQAMLNAIDRVQAVIEFDLGGHVLHANPHFLALMGYRLDEVRGQHHRLFCDPDYARSPAYERFWQQLGSGRVHDDEFRRLAKGGREVWIRASYNPVLDAEGHPVKVVKFATDITEVRQQRAQMQGLLAAIDHVQAVIEFDLGGRVLRANRNFLQLMGYQADEVVGQHHRMFCEPDYAKSPAYARFWEHLQRGQVHDDEFKRLGKHGREVWIRATYNPVFDPDGRLTKVVKFATDITAAKTQRLDDAALLEAFDKAQAGLPLGAAGGSSDTHH